MPSPTPQPQSAGEVRLPGGTLTTVTRVGDTVRRPTGPFSPRVHDLLRHLQAVGFEGAPRLLGVDEHGREMLSFIPGEVTADSPPAGMASDEALTTAATLLRGLHDATTGFAVGHPGGWRWQVGAPTGGSVICHNDVGPYNTVYRDGRPVAFIDFDFAAPAPREWDVAYALWRFVPLYDDARCVRLGWPVAPRGPRIARFLAAYGLAPGPDILTTLRRRQEVVLATIAAGAAAGDPAFVQLRREGRLPEIQHDLAYAAAEREQWTRHLR